MSLYNFKIDIKIFLGYNKSAMKIGNLEVKGFAALAPMAGVADRAMREICAQYGCTYSVGELASAKGIVLGDNKSAELLFCTQNLDIQGSQLFGSEPEIMAAAAQKALEYSPAFIDINMGCPAPKVAASGGGSSLMKNVPLAEKIVAAVVGVSKVPVTVKMRSGWDDDSINAVELAKACEAAGAAAIAVHGRTRKQMYAPPVNSDIIAEVKKSVKIPVIANGDVTDALSAKEMYEKTGCDFVMVGRGAMGNPFVFEEINAYFEGKEYVKPDLKTRLSVCQNQIELMHKYKDPHNAILEARKHTAWYLSGINGAAALRRMCGEISSLEDVRIICEKALEQNKDMW